MPKHDLRDALLSVWRASPRARTLAIKGTSMRPLIVDGDRIVIEPVQSATEVAIGDILVFEGASGLVAHRIIGRTDFGGRICYREKGDNRFYPACVDHQSVIGRVVQIQKAQSAIDLTSWQWKIISRILGAYWNILFRVLGGLVRIKKCRFGPAGGGWAARYARRLIRMPVWLLKRKTGKAP